MTKQNIAPRIDADFEQIKSVSKGTIKPSWSASDGYAREKAIEEARIEALEQYQTQLAERHDVFETTRFQMLEGAIADLQRRMKAVEGKGA